MSLESSSSSCDTMTMKAENSTSDFEKIVNVNDKVLRIRMRLRRPSSTSAVGDMHSKSLLRNYLNFKESGDPGRVMYYEADGSWVDYHKDVVDLVRRCFAQKNPVLEVNMGDRNTVFDFYRMLEIGFETGKERSISWIDVNGKCFFPNIFVNNSQNYSNIRKVNDNEVDIGSGFPMVEMEVKFSEGGKDSGDLTKKKRENEEVEEAEKGKSGRITRNMMPTPRCPNTRMLKETEKDQSSMQFENLLLSAIQSVEPGATITRIHRCVRNGPLQKARFELFMNQLQIVKKRRGEPNMTFAWYGTSAKGVENILAYGFGVSNQIPGFEAYGAGLHLSPVKFPHHSAMSSEVDNNGEKHMILCRVILGRCERIEAGSEQKFPSSEDFDSGTDDLENPRLYVVWPCNISTCILLEAVVSYKPGSTLRGQLKGNMNQKVVPTGMSAGGLLSKLRRCLPLPKVRGLEALYSSFKAGRMGREIFARHLRSLVGDELLRTIVREIHG